MTANNEAKSGLINSLLTFGGGLGAAGFITIAIAEGEEMWALILSNTIGYLGVFLLIYSMFRGGSKSDFNKLNLLMKIVLAGFVGTFLVLGPFFRKLGALIHVNPRTRSFIINFIVSLITLR